MGAYIIRRLLQAVLIIILVSILTFLMLRIMPGDPIMLYMQASDIQGMTEEEIGQLRLRFGRIPITLTGSSRGQPLESTARRTVAPGGRFWKMDWEM